MRNPVYLFGACLVLTLVLCLFGNVTAQKADSVVASLSSLPDTSKVTKLNLLATDLFFSDPEMSRELAERALELSRSSSYYEGEAASLRLIGNVFMRQGQFTNALDYCRQSEVIYNRIGDQSGIADVLNTVGMVYNQQGQYAPAQENFTKALKIRQDLKQNDQVPMLIENIGIIHFRQGDYRLALDFFQECLQAYKAQNNEGAASKILVNLGATYNKLGMREQALDAHRQSLAYFERNNNVMGMSIAYNNIGGVHYMLTDYHKAIENYSESLSLKKRLNDKRGSAVSLANLAEAYMMLNNLSKAKENIIESLRIAEEIGSMEQIKVAYEMLSKIHERSRDYEKALAFERKMTVAKDSLFSADKTAQISKMRAIYETEKAEQSAILTKLQADLDINRREQERNLFIVVALMFMALAGMVFYLYRQKQRSNLQLSEYNGVIEKTLKEREMLLKEIHHRVKNNLQIISSLLSLQSKSLHDPEAQGAIGESRNRVKSMSLIHEQLYQEDTVSGVDMKNYSERLISSLVSSYGLDTARVHVNVAADPILLDVDSAIPVGLIMNELVSNAIKYAFPDRREGNIRVSFQESEQELRLTVADNGIGMDSKNENTSFGLSMVRSLMRKLKAEMTIVSKAGTSVELIIRDFKKVTFAQ